jgi:hypothetical protein
MFQNVNDNYQQSLYPCNCFGTIELFHMRTTTCGGLTVLLLAEKCVRQMAGSDFEKLLSKP